MAATGLFVKGWQNRGKPARGRDTSSLGKPLPPHGLEKDWDGGKYQSFSFFQFSGHCLSLPLPSQPNRKEEDRQQGRDRWRVDGGRDGK